MVVFPSNGHGAAAGHRIAAFPLQAFQHLPKGGQGRLADLFQGRGIVLAVEYPGQNVLSESNLPVVGAVLADGFTSGQIHQPHTHRGASQVHADAVISVRRIAGGQGLPPPSTDQSRPT